MLRGIGICLLIFGAGWLALAFNMDTSVPTNVGYGMPDRVENIGLMAQRQNHMMVACLIVIVGTLMTIFGGSQGAVPQPTPLRYGSIPAAPPCDRDLSQDEYRLWLAEAYGIHRNEVFDRFVMNGKSYDSLEAALTYAHTLDIDQITKSQMVDEEKRIERQLYLIKQDERRAKTDKYYLWGSGSIIVLFGVIAVLFNVTK